MYVKTVVPGPLAIATLTATSTREVVFGQLIARGWGVYGDSPGFPTTTQLAITHRSLQLVVDGQVLLDDLDPGSPPGWWDAADRLGNCCVVVVLHDHLVDLHDPHLGERMQALMGDPDAGGWAVVPIRHPAAPDEF